MKLFCIYNYVYLFASSKATRLQNVFMLFVCTFINTRVTISLQLRRIHASHFPSAQFYASFPIRTILPLPPCNFPSPPLYLSFHPSPLFFHFLMPKFNLESPLWDSWFYWLFIRIERGNTCSYFIVHWISAPFAVLRQVTAPLLNLLACIRSAVLWCVNYSAASDSEVCRSYTAVPYQWFMARCINHS